MNRAIACLLVAATTPCTSAPLRAQDPKAAAGPRVYFNFVDAPATQVIETIAKISGSNVILSPGIDAVVTVKLENVGWREALSQTAALAACEVSETDGILRVRTTAELNETVTVSVPLPDRTPSASELAAWRSILTDRGTLDVAGEALRIEDQRRIVEALTAHVRDAATGPPREVLLDVRTLSTADAAAWQTVRGERPLTPHGDVLIDNDDVLQTLLVARQASGTAVEQAPKLITLTGSTASLQVGTRAQSRLGLEVLVHPLPRVPGRENPATLAVGLRIVAPAPAAEAIEFTALSPQQTLVFEHRSNDCGHQIWFVTPHVILDLAAPR